MQELYPDFNPELAARSDNLDLEPRAAANKVSTSLRPPLVPSRRRDQFADNDL